MAQIPTPPLSRQASEERQIEDQKKTKDQDQILLLDSLLERYLHLLDRHQTLQAELGKQLSSVRYDFILSVFASELYFLAIDCLSMADTI